MKRRSSILSALTLIATSFTMAVGAISLHHWDKASAVHAAPAKGTMPTTINLNDTSDADIRSYYSSLNSLPEAEKKGTNLLKNLRPIIHHNMKYFDYGTGGSNPNGVTAIYSITDRDWKNSPVSSLKSGTYNAATNTITGYNHKTDIVGNTGLYLQMLYVDYAKYPKTPYYQAGGTSVNFDKEHVWSQSIGFKANPATGPAGTDLHHLIAGERTVNQDYHSNAPYGTVETPVAGKDGTGVSTKATTGVPLTGNKVGTPKHKDPRNDSTQNVFEPNDADKGRIARALLYMVACYNNYSGKETITGTDANLDLVDYVPKSTTVTSTASKPVAYGVLSELLDWNRRFKPTPFEIHRNNLIYNNYQMNRNPFIDFPEWADYAWGTKATGLTPTGAANPTTDTINDWKADAGTGGGGSGGGTVTPGTPTLTVNPTSLTFTVGGAAQSVSATSSDKSAIEWNVAPAGVVNLSANSSASGASINVTPVGQGNATITAKIAGQNVSKTIPVTVNGGSTPEPQPQPQNSTVSILPKTLQLQTGATGKLTATESPDNGSRIVWDSNPAGITFNPTSSKSGIPMSVSASKAGTYTVTATINHADGTQSKDTATVTVTDPVTPNPGPGTGTGATDTLDGTFIGSTVYSNWANKKSATSNAVYAGNSTGGTKYIQIRSTSPSGIVQTTSGGTIESVEITFDSTVRDTRKVQVFGSNTAYNGTNGASDLYNAATRGTLIGEAVKSASALTHTINFTGDYKYFGLLASDPLYVQKIVVKYRPEASAIPTLNNIALDTTGVKTTYDKGQTLDTTNLKVTASYSDGSSKLVTPTSVTPNVLNNPGTQPITVSYTEGAITKTATYNVTVNAPRVLDRITIDAEPTKKVYNVGDRLDTAGLKVTAHYDNLTSQVVTPTSVTPETLTVAGPQTITVSYQEGGVTRNATFQVTVKAPKVLTGITLDDSLATKTFMEGTTFNHDGLKVTAHYDDKSQADVSNLVTVSQPNMNQVGPQTITVTYKEGAVTKTGTYQINITAAPKITKITLDTAKVAKTFYEGDAFNSNGLVVNAHYDNASVTQVTGFSVSSPDMTTPGTKQVTVTYQGFSATYDITVNAAPTVALSQNALTMLNGDIEMLSATSSDHSQITWSVAPAGIVSVTPTSSASGANVQIDALAAGQATITATATIGGKTVSDTCVVTVNNVTYPEGTIPSGGGSDTLVPGTFATGSTSYKVFANKAAPSSKAVYAGLIGGRNASIQLSDHVTAGTPCIVQTTSGGDVESITVTWNVKTAAGRTLEVWSKDTPYTDHSDFATTATAAQKGTSVGTIAATSATTLTLPAGSHKYVAFTAPQGAIYLTNITIKYKATAAPVTGITASCATTFHPGELLNKSDISVLDNNGKGIPAAEFTVTDNAGLDMVGYMFTYADTGAGGASVGTKTFTIKHATFTTTVTVNVSREAHVSNLNPNTAVNVANYIMYEDTSGQCGSKFQIALGYFNALDAGERSLLLESQDYVLKEAGLRLRAWAAYHGQTVSIVNGQYEIRAAKALNFGIVSDNDDAITFSVLGVAVAALGGYGLFLRRRKESHKA